jgi:hypothetical protein
MNYLQNRRIKQELSNLNLDARRRGSKVKLNVQLPGRKLNKSEVLLRMVKTYSQRLKTG